jgi:hypothetical protein
VHGWKIIGWLPENHLIRSTAQPAAALAAPPKSKSLARRKTPQASPDFFSETGSAPQGSPRRPAPRPRRSPAARRQRLRPGLPGRHVCLPSRGGRREAPLASESVGRPSDARCGSPRPAHSPLKKETAPAGVPGRPRCRAVRHLQADADRPQHSCHQRQSNDSSFRNWSKSRQWSQFMFQPKHELRPFIPCRAESNRGNERVASGDEAADSGDHIHEFRCGSRTSGSAMRALEASHEAVLAPLLNKECQPEESGDSAPLLSEPRDGRTTIAAPDSVIDLTGPLPSSIPSPSETPARRPPGDHACAPRSPSNSLARRITPQPCADFFSGQDPPRRARRADQLHDRDDLRRLVTELFDRLFPARPFAC